MKVVVKSKIHPSYDALIESLVIDGKRQVTVAPLCECPEDAILERDLIGPSTIVEYMKLAYEEGRAGREVEFSEEPMEDD